MRRCMRYQQSPELFCHDYLRSFPRGCVVAGLFSCIHGREVPSGLPSGAAHGLKPGGGDAFTGENKIRSIDRE